MLEQGRAIDAADIVQCQAVVARCAPRRTRCSAHSAGRRRQGTDSSSRSSRRPQHWIEEVVVVGNEGFDRILGHAWEYRRGLGFRESAAIRC